MSDDEIIEQRISGRSMRAIAKAKGSALADVDRALDLFTGAMFNDRVRKHTLALELARLDDLQEVFYRPAKTGDVQSAQLVTRIIERLCVIPGLHTPQTGILEIVAAQAPRETSTDRMERLVNDLLEVQRRSEPH